MERWVVGLVKSGGFGRKGGGRKDREKKRGKGGVAREIEGSYIAQMKACERAKRWWMIGVSF